MDERPAEAGAPVVATPDPFIERIDPRRVRSFIGLILGRLGPRAFDAVGGLFLILLVAERTSSLFAVTFALTAHRVVTFVAYPLAGRFSDQSRTAIGRRIPFMAGGLLVAGVCTALFTHTDGYWSLVGLLFITRLAFVSYTLPAAAVTPEAFGNSRWVRAGALVSVGGAIVGISIRLTAIATWKQSDPSTWSTSYYLSAVYMIIAGLAIVFLVREAPAAQQLIVDHPAVKLRDAVRSMLAGPNARPLLLGVLLAVAAGGCLDRAFPIYARDVLHAGGKELAAAGLWTALLGALGVPFGIVLARLVSRKTTILLATLTGTGTAIAHLWVTELWQSVVLSAFSAVFLVAAVVALAPLYLQLLPRSGGLGERMGTLFGPVLLAGMVGAFASAVARDVIVHDYRVIWIPTAIFSLASGLAYLPVQLPAYAKRADPKRGWIVLKKILWGRREQRHLFSGEIDHREADGALLLERIADELNPYVEHAVAAPAPDVIP